MLAALTGLGLSAAAGLNAYIPFLVVACLARWTSVVELPASWEWMESTPALVVGFVLLLVDVVLDKVPVVDSVNDAVQTAIRPASAGVIVAATTAAQAYEDSSSFLAENSWIGILGGVLVALAVHATKATVRPVANAATVGTGAPVLSTLEDGASISMALLAVFLPVIAFVLLVVSAVSVLAFWRRIRRVRGPVRP